MEKKTTVINHPSELNSLSTFPIFRRRGLGNLVISQSFEHPEKRELEQDLNRYYYACGCATSAKLLIAGVIVGLGYSLFGYQDMEMGTAVLSILGAGIGGAVVGKVIGLFRANSNLKRTIDRIKEVWRPKVKQEEELILCG